MLEQILVEQTKLFSPAKMQRIISVKPLLNYVPGPFMMNIFFNEEDERETG